MNLSSVSRALNKNRENFVSISKAAKHLSVSPVTLRRWDKDGKLKANRTAGGARRYSTIDLDRVRSEYLLANKSDKISISEAAQEIGVTPKTLRLWEKKGKIKPRRDRHNKRQFDKGSLKNLLKSREKVVHEVGNGPLLPRPDKDSSGNRVTKLLRPGVYRFKLVHFHVVQRPNLYLSNRLGWYKRWHQFPYHPHIHWFALTTYIIGVVTGVYIALSGLLGVPIFASVSPWDQTDWSGGTASGTVNGTVTTYESASNIDTSVAGELSLEAAFGTAILKGNQLSGGSTDFNVASKTSLQYNTSQTYDDKAFSYNGGSPTRLTVDQDGDYLVSLSLPITSNSIATGNRNAVEAEIRVNGTKVDYGVGRSSYIRNSSQSEASNHLAVLLTGLSTTDYIEIFVARTTTETTNALTGPFTLYAEQIDSSETVLSATGTQTTSGTNLNGVSASMEWSSDRKDSGYTHANGSNPHQITLDASGDYLVTINIPTGGAVARGNLIGRVMLDGAQVDGGIFQQGYIRNYDGHIDSSIHWSGVVRATGSGQILTVTVEQEAVAGTITTDGEKATIFIQKLPSEGVYLGEATRVNGGDDWNPASKSTVDWATDEIIDTNVYTHSTSSNEDQITVNRDGDYLLSINSATNGGSARANPKITVQVDGVDVTGAESKSAYRRQSSGHDRGSDQLLVLLEGLSSGAVITVSIEREGAAGVVNDDTPALIMLWLKSYTGTGTLTSNIFDAEFPADWGNITFNSSGSGTVVVKVRTDANSDMSGATAWGSCSNVSSGSDSSSNGCVTDTDEYYQYQVILTPSSGQTPTFEDISIAFISSDTTPPTTNASSIEMYNTNGGSQIASNEWANNVAPFYTWTAGADNPGGSGLKGYCLYVGTDSNGDPATSKGLLGTSPVDTSGSTCQFIIGSNSIDLATASYRGSPWLTSSTGSYYMNIKAIDLGNNIFSGASSQFQFRFDNTAPSNPLFVSPPSNFQSSKTVTITWPTSGGDGPSDAHSGLAGLQYQIENCLWYGDNHTGVEDETDLLANDGSYTTVDPPDFPCLSEGNNVIRFRIWDVAGNVTTAYVTGIIKINTASPSPPQNVAANPTTNTVNSFAFSWLAPASYTGQESNINYCYTVNTLPSVSSCTFTAGGVTSLSPGPYATQPGQNTFYVVARDEAQNINYATYAFITFTANTSAPGIPANIDIADISVKATSNWKLAITWEEPGDVGAGIDSYKVYLSTDNVNFSQTASTSGESFVDTSLAQQTYYYYVTACDSANNCGANSAIVSELPTGKFTQPALLTAEPKVGGIGTKKATISWASDRTSDSKIAYGTKSGQYFTEEVTNSSQVTDHSITLNNLNAGTLYYYVAKWADEDGNTGISSEYSFTTKPPPTIKEVTTKNVNLTNAIVEFTAKDATKVKIFFGKTTDFGGLKEVYTSTTESTYTVELLGLDDGTKYYFKPNPFDEDNNEYEGTVFSFSTLPRPRITNLRFDGVPDEPTSTIKVTWQTNVPTTSTVNYTPEGGVEVQSFSAKLKTDHKAILRQLADDTVYSITASGRDQLGNLAVSDINTFRTELDTRPPKVSDFSVDTAIEGTGGKAKAQLIVSWKTDEPATSQVEFGEGIGGGYTSKTVEDTNMTVDHVVIISELTPSNTYHLRAVSRDKSNNEGYSEDLTTVTSRASENVLDIIIGTLSRSLGFLGNPFGIF